MSAHRHTSDAAGEQIPRRLLLETRPIGAGPRFHPPARGPVIGSCRRGLGARSPIHLEVFAANRVVLVPAGIGTRAPRRQLDGRIISARCYGELVTLDATGVVLVRRGQRITLAQIFGSWGQPLDRHRLLSFTSSGRPVQAFVDGRRWTGRPGAVPLAPRSEIVVEIGPYVPPHSRFAFPPV